MLWFKNEIKRVEKEIGLKFETETGGYHFEWTDETLKITDEFKIFIHFSDKDPYIDSHGYKVDFKNKNLKNTTYLPGWIHICHSFYTLNLINKR